jgi:hypothetical protein
MSAATDKRGQRAELRYRLSNRAQSYTPFIRAAARRGHVTPTLLKNLKNRKQSKVNVTAHIVNTFTALYVPLGSKRLKRGQRSITDLVFGFIVPR